jgi:hypothetical protein
MKKTLFNIDSQEKQRILEMHQNATNRLYLNEQEVTKQTPTPKPVDDSDIKISYRNLEKSIWPLIHNRIAIVGTRVSQGDAGIISWTYPKDKKDTISVYTDGKLDDTKKDIYDIEFKTRLDQASKDDTWLNETINVLSENLIRLVKDIKPFQTYIMDNIKNKDLVKDNGSGGVFNDGNFGVVTLKAFLNFKMQSLNNQDSRYLIANKFI